MAKTGPYTTTDNLFTTHFSSLEDPRRSVKGNFLYPFEEILFLVISATVSNADGWTAIASFGKIKLDWLRKFFPYKNGTPSHDTLGTVFSCIDPAVFSKCFTAWINSISKLTKGEVVAIDGKTARGSAFGSESPVHVVSAYAAKNRLCLGQETVGKKSNEITAIPVLLESLALNGCVVTIDAMGCQKNIADKIIAAGADYILMVKANQHELKEQTEKIFSLNNDFLTFSCSIDGGHGRIEKRTCDVVQDLSFFDVKDQWTEIKSVIRITSERMCKKTEKKSKEIRYYISSLSSGPESLSQNIRDHWSVENNLHWSLDVIFKEDSSLKKKGFSAQNYNIIAKMSLALLEKEKTMKASKVLRRQAAALDDNYRERVIKS